MKILLDTNISFWVRDRLILAGYDVIWTGDWEVDPGDEEILNFAYGEERILITQDKDFGELAIVRSQPHRGIIRLSNLSTAQHFQVCMEILTRYGDELLNAAIITVDSRRVRIRSTDIL
jgi:predicted nuclease of predicted toxin-antitoxin system